MRLSAGLTLAALFVAIPSASAQGPTHRKAVEAKRVYQRAVTDAEAEFRQAMLTALRDYDAALDGAMTDATQAGDLGEANRIRFEKEQLAQQIAVWQRRPVRSEVEFSTPEELKRFVFRDDTDYELKDGELLVRRGMVTFDSHYDSINTVTLYARIVPPATTNVRMSVGAVNMILNWEQQPRSIYRYGDKPATHVNGNILTPGRTHEITVRQRDGNRIEIYIDKKRVYATTGELNGTVSFYPAKSEIAVRKLVVVGIPDPARPVSGPSHRTW